MKAIIIIPAFNESAVIFRVIKSLPQKISGVTTLDIVVVDDGSTDGTDEEALRAGATVLRHIVNRGAGAATRTGLEYAKKNKYNLLISYDADGQHSPEDILSLSRIVMNNDADLVIGSRFKRIQSVPVDRFILNWMANVLTFFLFGVFSTDSQSGLKAFSKKAIEMIDFKSDRMEFSSEILLEAKRNSLRIKEIPVKAIYTKYSKMKGQKNSNALPVFVRILVKLLR